MVHQTNNMRDFYCNIDLNTSYVMVHQLSRAAGGQRKSLFKYILCYGSSFEWPAKVYNRTLFKYILCYGSSVDNYNCHITAQLFKYILCYGSSLLSLKMYFTAFSFKYILCYGSSLYFKPFLKCDILILPVFKRFLQIFTNRLTIFSNFV